MSLFTEFLGELKEFPNIRNYQAIIVNLVSCDDYVVRQEKKKSPCCQKHIFKYLQGNAMMHMEFTLKYFNKLDEANDKTMIVKFSYVYILVYSNNENVTGRMTRTYYESRN